MDKSIIKQFYYIVYSSYAIAAPHFKYSFCVMITGHETQIFYTLSTQWFKVIKINPAVKIEPVLVNHFKVMIVSSCCCSNCTLLETNKQTFCRWKKVSVSIISSILLTFFWIRRTFYQKIGALRKSIILRQTMRNVQNLADRRVSLVVLTFIF